MKPGDKVLVFTASDTYRGAKGVIVESARDGAFVHIVGERAPVLCTRGELVPLDSQPHMVAGE